MVSAVGDRPILERQSQRGGDMEVRLVPFESDDEGMQMSW